MSTTIGRGLTTPMITVDGLDHAETLDSNQLFERDYKVSKDHVINDIFKIDNFETLLTENKVGIVVYCDGGCRPSRGKGGYGIHGYLYTTDKPKQGSGAKATPTAKGYIDGPEGKDNAVTVLGYFDLIVPMKGTITNNLAELSALIETYRFIQLLRLKTALILTDSEYCRNGLEKWVHNWIKSDWKKRDGTPVENKVAWELLLDAQGNLEKDCAIKIQHVKGHNGEIGNTAADNLASRAVVLAHEAIDNRVITFSPAKGYWNVGSGITVNRMFSKSQLYFNTHIETPKTSDGRYIYYLGKHGNDDSLFGKPMPEASFSVIYVKEPEPIIEVVKQRQDTITAEGDVRVVIARMAALFNPRYYRDIRDNGGLFIAPKPKTNNLRMVDKTEVTFECMPPALAYHGVNTIGSLEDILQRYIAKPEDNKHLSVTDITDQLYDISLGGKNKDKTVYKLKKSITVSTRYIDHLVSYDTQRYRGAMKTRLVMDMDLPSRNVLSALATSNPTVKVLTWPESDNSFRVATIVEADGDIGIYAAMYSNLNVVDAK